ncbi:MAG: hypothetical protein SOU51_01200 [Collinsella sp.]|nr:hypothetical protein [Collinsella sp.]
MIPLAPLVAALVGWTSTRAWSHRAVCGFSESDLGYLENRSTAFAADRDAWLERVKEGIRLDTVSPAIARRLIEAGELSDKEGGAALTGAYARRFDARPMSHLASLPIYAVASFLGYAAAGGVGCVLAVSATCLAEVDDSFRLVPVPFVCAEGAASALCFWHDPVLGLASLAALTLLACIPQALAKRVGAEWGTGDTMAIAIMLSALAPSIAGLSVFLVTLTTLLGCMRLMGARTVPLCTVSLAPFLAAIVVAGVFS